MMRYSSKPVKVYFIEFVTSSFLSPSISPITEIFAYATGRRKIRARV